MRAAIAIFVALLALLPANLARAQEWRLVWSDEFDGPRIDPKRWNLAVDCWGGGNAERQCYTASPHNAAVRDGKLVISAFRERMTGPALPEELRRRSIGPVREATRAFTSARLSTRGKAAWRYGRIAIRAMLPQGQGSWPAFWMLPAEETYGSWAASGEIDILEAVNLGVACAVCRDGREDRVLGTLHFGGKAPANARSGEEAHVPAVLEGFHEYAVEWDADRILWQVDGQTYAERRRETWWSAGSPVPGAPFDRPFYLIINLAIGGGLAESRGLGGVSPAGFPRQFVIDWVRVWQRDASMNDQFGKVGGK